MLIRARLFLLLQRCDLKKTDKNKKNSFFACVFKKLFIFGISLTIKTYKYGNFKFAINLRCYWIRFNSGLINYLC